MIVIIVQCK